MGLPSKSSIRQPGVSENVDLMESVWSPGSGARSHVLLVSSQTHLSCKCGSKNDWVSRMRPSAQSQRSGSAHPPPTPSSFYMSASNGLFFGAHFSFIAAGVILFQIGGAQHVTNFDPCAPHDQKPHSILRTIKQTINTHQGTYGDGTATTLTAHQWFQNLCLFFGPNWPVEPHELVPCCTNEGHSRIVTEMVWNNKDKKWGTQLEYPYLKRYITLSKASSKSSQLRSWLPLAMAKGKLALLARGTKRRVTTARRRLNWLRVLISVEMSSQSEETIAAWLTPMKY